jgi:hypothetical protein
MKDLAPAKSAFELSLSASQRFGRFAFSALVGYLCTQVAEKAFEGGIKWCRRRKSQ